MRHLLKGQVTGYVVKPARRLSLIKHLQEGDEAMAAHAAAELRAAAASVQRSDRRGLSVLLAEDNQINALLARTMLEKAGHRVLHVVNGQEASWDGMGSPDQNPSAKPSSSFSSLSPTIPSGTSARSTSIAMSLLLRRRRAR